MAIFQAARKIIFGPPRWQPAFLTAREEYATTFRKFVHRVLGKDRVALREIWKGGLKCKNGCSV